MANMGAAANRCRGHNAGADFADLVTEIATPAKGQFVKKMCVTRSNDLVPVDTKRQQDGFFQPLVHLPLTCLPGRFGHSEFTRLQAVQAEFDCPRHFRRGSRR
jgi:hypothetical protein